MDDLPAQDNSLSRRSSIKRRYDTMADSDSVSVATSDRQSIRDPHYTNEHRAQRPRLESQFSGRFAGDGLDFRRPVSTMSEARQSPSLFVEQEPEMIDLTRETLALPSLNLPAQIAPAARPNTTRQPRRLPRFSRDDIIDISSEDEDVEVMPVRSRDNYSRRPGVNTRFTGDNVMHDGSFSQDSARTLQHDESFMDDLEAEVFNMDPDNSFHLDTSEADIQPHTMSLRERSELPQPVVDLTDDDIEFIESRSIVSTPEPTRAANTHARPGQPPNLPYSVGLFASMIRATASDVQGRLGPRIVSHYNAVRRLGAPNHTMAERVAQLHNAVVDYLPNITASNAQIPGPLDYSATGFNLNPSPPPHREDSPAYEAPDSPSSGFTRSPGENEVVVCPNCGDELAQGQADLKRQVWVVKACGHAYCGECIDARLKSTAKSRGKAAQLATMPNGNPLLKSCAVEGCGKNITKAGVVHVYMSE